MKRQEKKYDQIRAKYRSIVRVKEKTARATAFVMAMIMVFTSVDVTAFAGENTKEKAVEKSQTIIGFENLSDKVENQTLPVGAVFEDIVFPETVTARLLLERRSHRQVIQR